MARVQWVHTEREIEAFHHFSSWDGIECHQSHHHQGIEDLRQKFNREM